MDNYHSFKSSIVKLSKDVTLFKNNIINKKELNKEVFLNISYLFDKLNKISSKSEYEFYFPYLNLSYSFMDKLNHKLIKKKAENDLNEEFSFEEEPIVDLKKYKSADLERNFMKEKSISKELSTELSSKDKKDNLSFDLINGSDDDINRSLNFDEIESLETEINNKEEDISKTENIFYQS